MLYSALHKTGFTLVELLIVVAIIGILSAIAIPQLTQYRSDAQVARVQSDLTTCIKEAAAEYSDQQASKATSLVMVRMAQCQKQIQDT